MESEREKEAEVLSASESCIQRVALKLENIINVLAPFINMLNNSHEKIYMSSHPSVPLNLIVQQKPPADAPKHLMKLDLAKRILFPGLSSDTNQMEPSNTGLVVHIIKNALR